MDFFSTFLVFFLHYYDVTNSSTMILLISVYYAAVNPHVDSKQLTEEQREKFFAVIKVPATYIYIYIYIYMCVCVCVCVCVCTPLLWRH